MYSRYYTEQRVRSFRKRKDISNESTLQGVVAAVAVTLLIIVGGQFIFAQRDLTQARVDYVSTVEGE